MYVRHAAFIEGVELFAATTFSINKVSKREAGKKNEILVVQFQLLFKRKHDEVGF